MMGRKIARCGCILLLVCLLGAQAVGTVSAAGEKRKVTTEGLTSFSTAGNVVVFIIDRFDEDYAEKAYAETPEVFGELTGFTWYQDNIAMFGHTYPAVAWMLTNEPYSCEVGRKDYQNTVFYGETPLKKLRDEGYAIRVYTQSYYGYGDESHLPEYFANVLPNRLFYARAERMRNAMGVLRTALSCCMRFSLTDLHEVIAAGVEEPSVAEGSAYTTDMKELYELFTASDFTLQGNKRFSYIHVDGCHDVTYNENWETPSEAEAGDRAVAVRASFRLIGRYLQEMKRLGVYDDATILITGDHSAAHHDGREVREVRLTALFVKPAGSGSGELQRSSAQVSQEDFWATIFRSEGIAFDEEAYGTPVFEVPEGQDRRRIHRWHTYQSKAKSLDEYVYEIIGPGRDFSNWKEISHEHWDKFLMD